MARDFHRNRIRSTSPRDRTAGSGVPDSLRNCAVRSGLAEWNRLQISPDPPLKRRCPNVERKCRIKILATHVLQQGIHPGPQSPFVFFSSRKRKFSLQPFQQFAIAPPELDRANSAIGCSNHHSSQTGNQRWRNELSPRSLLADTYPESCQVAKPCARKAGCSTRNPRRTSRELPNPQPAGSVSKIASGKNRHTLSALFRAQT